MADPLPGSYELLVSELRDALAAAQAAREDCVTEGIRVLERAERAEGKHDTLREAFRAARCECINCGYRRVAETLAAVPEGDDG